MAKKLLVTGMAAVMALSVAACGSDKNDENNASNNETATTPKTEGASTTTETDAPKDKVTYSMFIGVSGEKDLNTNETKIGKILEDQTGVNMKIEHLVGDLNTKIGTYIAGQKYPDVMVPDAGIEEILKAKAFIPLDDLIEQYGPNIKRVYGPYFERMKADYGGHIYFLPFSAQVGAVVPDPNINQGAFWVQRRVLKEAGYPVIKTMDQYTKLIEDFVAKHPEEDLIGTLTLTNDWRFFATSNVPMHLDGFPNDGNVEVDVNTLDAKTYAGSDSTKRWLQTLNTLNAKGLFDKSSFVDNYDQYIAKLTSKKVVGFFDYGWQVGTATAALNDAARKDPTQDDYKYFPMAVTWDGTKDQYLDPAGWTSNRGIGITTSAKNPERIIQYWDNMLKEENQVLISWGVKGETYEVNEQGRFYRTKEQIDKIDEAFKEQYGFKTFDWDFPAYNQTSTFADGNAKGVGFQPEVFEMSLTDGDKEILAKYGLKTYADIFTKPEDRPWFPAWSIPKEQGSAAQIWETKKDDLTKKYFSKLVLAKPADFEGVWADYKKEFDKLDTAGYEKWYVEQIKKVVEVAK
ncbi:ABC transporter substrate-binding protein [Paenibacillus sp. CCS19]|uniref:ABC transporter substrate-binding protein n=1 Tax=Paenibacillus sp. CCS19 TaxID=3158387 RepID=UPI00255E286D|nr:ABC transporter substrate-binding protein [Paenibacillus cellulosilyticus]GMK40377.1 ABC transporter substrate-binding protein [Paenibacillus cellulosilyticus]